MGSVRDWVFSDTVGADDRIDFGGLELRIDGRQSRVERLGPGAAIESHAHSTTEEVYCVLAGALEMTIVEADGQERTDVVAPGELHFVKIGQSHHGRAGAEGARFVVAARTLQRKL